MAKFSLKLRSENCSVLNWIRSVWGAGEQFWLIFQINGRTFCGLCSMVRGRGGNKNPKSKTKGVLCREIFDVMSQQRTTTFQMVHFSHIILTILFRLGAVIKKAVQTFFNSIAISAGRKRYRNLRLRPLKLIENFMKQIKAFFFKSSWLLFSSSYLYYFRLSFYPKRGGSLP